MTVHPSVTDLMRRAEDAELARRAHHDALTGLPTRLLLTQTLERVLARRVTHAPIALLLIDLDNFKQVNEFLGHDTGDAVLLQAAQRLVAATRAQDTVARLGGDEFLVLCENTNAAGAGMVAERILHALQHPADGHGAEARVTGSIGIATAAQHHGPTDLLREASAAMRLSKSRGGNQTTLFDLRLGGEAGRLLDIETALREGLERDELVLHYQPIHTLADGSLKGVEALVRWNRPEHGLVPPDDFIPIAEDTGLIVPLGEWVLNEALRQLSTWKRAGVVPANFTISVNLSPVQLLQAGLVDLIDGTIAEHGLTHEDLVLEMTETALILDRSTMMDTVSALAETGASLAIDDFGTGYSSLSYLRYLPAKQLKVDRSFVAGLTTDPRDAALVAAVVRLAHEFGMTCVAEGVETPEQLEHLRLLGCDLAQGYFLGRPATAEVLTRSWAPAGVN
ncbi:bifunctional diguanylate cyclase/phosphodiesterase [Cryobacterium sp. Sr8]|uniref:putative bifunctional diguanylate cyclase/phosphodiesterase n=1 Tax=Cryobacterium sp. Sr8 TaxID=1259203 RepID=UPI00106D9F44|nr:bifunctional diguanylate cyclase/phosphodiesterase [Cryobacterium sp. Sr8]TFD79121.1 bifunctional diguanylate cyclase/phosphodiesterase [Cryobacterium sp. Sr8]